MATPMTWLELQAGLKTLHYRITMVDGIPGPETRAAVRDFQTINALEVTGRVDEELRALLKKKLGRRAVVAFGPQESTDVPPWHVIARSHMNVAEIVGPRHSPVIMGWIQKLGAKVLGIEVTDDETPWCGTFAALCVATALEAEVIPIPAVRASAWDDFGVDLDAPALGAVVRFQRPGGGHVGFYEGQDDTHIHVLGGNTSNKVGVARIEHSRLRAIRWPSTYPAPTTGIRRLSPSGVPISQNEA